MTFHVPEQYRITKHRTMASDARDGNNGAFEMPSPIAERTLWIVASDGLGWEHVSVHAEQKGRSRTPVWMEMCRVKDVFWDDDDVVVQFHPRASDYVNYHENTLHLWRPTDVEMPTPDPIMVGPKTAGGKR